MRAMSRFHLASASIAIAIAPAAAQAAQAPHALHNESGIEVAEGFTPASRGAPDKRPEVGAAAAPVWASIRGDDGTAWRAMWNPMTGVPQRMFGAGIAAPGSVRSPASAEEHARAALRAHLDELAPGAAKDDFVLAANHLDDTGMRTVSFFQQHAGVPVVGGQVNFRFRNDRLFMMGSEALPHVRAPAALRTVSNTRARDSARDWLRGEFGPREMTAGADVSDRLILPIVRGPGAIEYHSVRAVHVDAPTIPASWEVYVDSATGAPVARRQLLAFGSATALFDVPVRRPGGERDDFPASFLSLNVQGLETVSDFFGQFFWGPSESQEVSFLLRGPFVRINNTGDDASRERVFDDGAVEVFGAPDNEFDDAQLALFVHTNRAKEYVRRLTSNPWLDDQLEVVANLSGSCNAFYSPVDDSINFLVEGNGCNNTGRLADVIYHEFGHAIHVNAIIPGVGGFDGAMSEGVSDYLAATITDDPGMGRGFRLNDPEAPLRHLDPESIGEPRKDYRFDLVGQVHADGEIIGATLWQLRQELIEKHGPERGVAQADRIWYGILQRSTTMPTAYAEALAADDDDGDLSNGTPNSCIINRAFAAGGLGALDDSAAEVVPGIAAPVLEDYDLALPVREPEGCSITPIGFGEVTWQQRETPTTSGRVVLEREGGSLVATLPEQPDDTVLQYQVEVVYENGSNTTYPKNPAAPFYEVFIGDLDEIYHTDFDTNPFEEGWTSDAAVGENVWEWGEPGGVGLGGGPTDAYSGQNVLATDLATTGYGLYPNNSLMWVESPDIIVTDLDTARLQFRRWLAVEDGFFDQARIYVNDELVWENANSNEGDASDTHHIDHEWRFHDIDLTEFIPDQTVRVRFELESDEGLEFAGWAIDDFRIVGAAHEPDCPDFEIGEVCDGECPPECEPPDDDDNDGGGRVAPETSSSGCGCAAGATTSAAPGATLLGFVLLAFVAGLRRRRPA